MASKDFLESLSTLKSINNKDTKYIIMIIHNFELSQENNIQMGEVSHSCWDTRNVYQIPIIYKRNPGAREIAQ